MIPLERRVNPERDKSQQCHWFFVVAPLPCENCMEYPNWLKR